ncbi:GNAT family N-acetyltransferase [candidate division GN15 bacterium]|nr:GNAT family N-acetyltransferase [candidate division GN15 bacterium]
MPAIGITSPDRNDRLETESLFDKTIRDTFAREGIVHRHAHDIPEEIAARVATLEQFLRTSGETNRFLVARSDDTIVGTVAASSANDIIRANLDASFDTTPEITCAYVLPEWQGRGVGRLLLREMLLLLHRSNVRTYCLDCGYRRAQHFWQRRLGEPAVVLTDRYGAGAHHLIWHGSVHDALDRSSV